MSIRKFLGLLCFASLTNIQLSSCLTLCSQQQQQLIGFGTSRKLKYESRRSGFEAVIYNNDVGSSLSPTFITLSLRSQLLSKKTNDEGDNDEMNNDNTNNTNKKSIAASSLPPDLSLLMDPGLWISDFLAVILASQLIGLLDVVNNPTFIQNGGWFQPVLVAPTTLDDLVQRISSSAIIWAISSASVILFVKTTTSTSTSTTSTISDLSANEKQNNSDRNDVSIILKRNIQTLVLFGILQIVLSGIIFGFHANDPDTNYGFMVDGEPVIEWLDILRNCYYVGWATSALRYLYGRYFLF